MKLPVTMSSLECGVQYLAIGLLGKLSFFEIIMNSERCIDIELIRRLTEHETA